MTGRRSVHRISLLLCTALLAGLGPSADAHGQELDRVAAREALEQAMATAHNDARRDRTRWTTRGDEPPVRAIPAREDLRAQARTWARRMSEGVCGDAAIICHNDGRAGPSFHELTCCALWVAENVAYVPRFTATPVRWTPELIESWAHELNSGWMRSDGHRRAIMGPDWDDFAVGIHLTETPHGGGYLTAVWATGMFRQQASLPPSPTYDAWGHRWRTGLVADNLGVTAPPATEVPPPLEPTTVCPGSTTRFPDLDPASSVGRAAACLADRGIARGTTSGTFAPSQPVTRGQMAAFLTRLLDEVGADTAAASTGFVDIDGHAHADAIARLVAADITQGRTPTTFDPNGVVSRGQMAAFLARTYRAVTGDLLPTGPGGHFHDTAGTVAETDADRLVTAGVAAGRAPGRFAPSEDVTRGQMTLFLTRLHERLAVDGAATP